MPIVNRVADLQPDIQAWRREIHEHPELLYEVHALRHSWRTGCGNSAAMRWRPASAVTGVVGVIKGKKAAGKGELKVIGLRADMDALPIEEATKPAFMPPRTRG